MTETMKTYNGHRSWNAWNVSLWINNDESLYRYALELLSKHKLGRAAYIFSQSYDKTPDGARYNHLSVKLAMQGLTE